MDVITNKTQHGFTLIELIIIIVIMSVLGTYVLIRNPRTSINLGAEAKQLGSDIRYTQALAMTKGERYYLQKLSSTSYQILSASGTPVMMPTGSTSVTLDNGTLFGSFSNLPNNLIAFDGKGTPYITSSSPGTALASTASMAVTDGTATITVSITAQTGRVIVQ